jgi:hypothetical protein
MVFAPERLLLHPLQMRTMRVLPWKELCGTFIIHFPDQLTSDFGGNVEVDETGDEWRSHVLIVNSKSAFKLTLAISTQVSLSLPGHREIYTHDIESLGTRVCDEQPEC